MYDVNKCEWVSECTLLWKDACYLNKRPTIMCLAKKKKETKKKNKKEMLHLPVWFSLKGMDGAVRSFVLSVFHAIHWCPYFQKTQNLLQTESRLWWTFCKSRQFLHPARHRVDDWRYNQLVSSLTSLSALSLSHVSWISSKSSDFFLTQKYFAWKWFYNRRLCEDSGATYVHAFEI